MVKELCKPCALGMAADGKSVKQLPAKCQKITCAACGRRRFGLPYEVTGRRKKQNAPAAV